MTVSKQPLVSVVIPIYNRGDLLVRAIDSVLKQSYQNLEIIAIDDCSQEDIAGAIATIQDSRLRYHRHTSNLGGSAARNTGIKMAQGEYIAFLDSDDVWLPNKLELQLKAIQSLMGERNNHSNNVVCYSKFQKYSTVFYQPSVLPPRGKKPTETVADYLWLHSGEMLTSTLLVSRSLAVANLFQINLAKHQDLDFVLRLDLNQAEFIFVPQILTIWYNESRGDRVSRIDNYRISQAWIEGYRERISELAYLGFLLKEVAPKMLKDPSRIAEAKKLLNRGLFKGIISPFFWLFLMLQQTIPKQYQNYLKTLIATIKLSKNL